MEPRPGLELLEPLGGSRAAVHRAVQRGTGRLVVTKQASWDRPDVAAGLRREAAVLTRVEHRALPRLLDVIEDPDGICLVLSLATGGSLARRLATQGPLEPTEAAAVGASLAGALAALHAAGVVHRDVHPGNVLFDAELMPVLADLDHALDSTDGHLAADDEVVGHPDHLDPRLLEGAAPGPASDLYGLGSVVRAAVAGVTQQADGPLAQVIAGCIDGRITTAAAAATAFESARLALASAAASTARRGTTPPRADDVHGVQVLSNAAVDGGTRRYGPLPPPRPRRLTAPARRAGWLALAATILALPVLGAGVLVLRDAPPDTAGGVGVPPVDAGPIESADAVAPPPACADPAADTSEHADGRVVLHGDLDGVGCSASVTYDAGVLTTPTGRFTLGEASDQAVLGDWDGDGRWTPGLYRPATGEVFLFDATPDSTALVSRPAETHAAGGRALVVVGPDGRHEVRVISGAASAAA